MESDNKSFERFASLTDLRKAHDELLQSQGARAGRSNQGLNLAKIGEFVGRASATGAILYAPEDRRAVQGLIDYWVASSFSLPRARGVSERLSPTSVLLKEFDTQFAVRAAERAEEFIKTLKQENETDKGLNILARLRALFRFKQSDLDIVRRLMLALVRLPTDGDMVTLAPARLSVLLALGEPDRVKDLIDRLVAIDVLAKDQESEDPLVRLSYSSLITQWPWLSLLVNERMSFRRMALEWARRGRKSTRLLFGLRANLKFRAYGNLNALEQQYVYASELFGRRLGTLVAWLFLIAGSFYYAPILSDRIFLTKDQIESRETSILRDATGEVDKKVLERVQTSLKWLSDNRRIIDAPATTLKRMNLANLFGPAADFTNTRFEIVGLNRAFLRGSLFLKAKLSFVDLGGADLKNSMFSGAIIADTKFNDANLVRVNFEGVRFCGGVDFSNADVRYASVRNVSYPPGKAPKVDGIAWWLIDGWTLEQRRRFGETRHDRSKLLPSLEKEFKELQPKFMQVGQNRFSLALWLNEYAWLQAIYGYDGTYKDMTGEQQAAAAIGILDSLEGTDTNRDYSLQKANVMDTLGYILLQKAHGAAELLQKASGDDKQKSIQERDQYLTKAIKYFEGALAADSDGGIMFRYAIALHAAGEVQKAFAQLAIAAKKDYSPTHELYLLASFVTGPNGGFLKKWEELKGGGGTADLTPSPEADVCSQLLLPMPTAQPHG